MNDLDFMYAGSVTKDTLIIFKIVVINKLQTHNIKNKFINQLIRIDKCKSTTRKLNTQVVIVLHIVELVLGACSYTKSLSTTQD